MVVIAEMTKWPLPPGRADRGAMSSAVAGPLGGAQPLSEGDLGGLGRSVADATPTVQKGLLRAIRETAARQCTGME